MGPRPAAARRFLSKNSTWLALSVRRSSSLTNDCCSCCCDACCWAAATRYSGWVRRYEVVHEADGRAVLGKQLVRQKHARALCTLLRLPAPQAVVGPPPPPPSQGGFVRHANTVTSLPAACAAAERADRAPWPAGRRCREEPWRCRACFGLRAAAEKCHVRSQVMVHALQRGVAAGWRMGNAATPMQPSRQRTALQPYAIHIQQRAKLRRHQEQGREPPSADLQLRFPTLQAHSAA